MNSWNFYRVLTIHGSEDETIPVTDAFEFDKLITNHVLHVMDGADHCYNSHQNEVSSVVLSFIKSSWEMPKEKTYHVAPCSRRKGVFTSEGWFLLWYDGYVSFDF